MGRGGFTIIEVLIVLAITGALFVSALSLISGRQNKTQFAQGARDAQAKIQQAANEVSSGYFKHDGSMECEVSPSERLRISTSGGSIERGTSKECTFVGKALQFDVAGSANNELVHVYGVLGRRTNASGTFTTLDDARPKVAAISVSNQPTDVPEGMYDVQELISGLSVVRITYGSSAPSSPQIGAFAFISQIGSLGATDGSQQVNVVALPGTTFSQSKIQGVRDINDALDGISPTLINPVGGIHVCLKSGTTNNQSVLLSVGSGGRASEVDLRIMGTDNCT